MKACLGYEGRLWNVEGVHGVVHLDSLARMNAGSIGIATRAILTLLGCSAVARASDWYVDANNANCASGTGGPNDPFCRIADAVAAAVDGDTLLISPASYFENVVLDKDLTLIGTAGYATTIVDGSSAGSVFIVNPGVTV